MAEKQKLAGWQKGILICGAVLFGLCALIGLSTGSKTDDNGVKVSGEGEERDAQIERLNKWFEEDYKKREDNQTFYEGQYIEQNHMLSLIKRFEHRDGDIYAVVYYNNMTAEGWEQKDFVGIAKATLYAYDEDLHYKNFDSGLDGESIKTASKFQWYYIEVE